MLELVSEYTETYDYSVDGFCSDNSFTYSLDYSLPGKWDFAEKKSQLEMEFSNTGKVWEFDIVKLSNQELELDGRVNSETVEIEATKE